MHRWIAAVLVMAAAALSPASADRADDEKVLTRIKTEDWPAFYRQQDVDGLSAYLDPAFVNIAPDGSVTSRAEELAWVAGNRWNPQGFSYTIDRFDWFADDLVLVIGTGRSLREDEQGAPCRHSYVSSNLVRRAPGAPLGWQALASHVSGVRCERLAAE